MNYTLRVTIAAPVAHIDKANQLALCIGESPSDCNTFTQANYKDTAGNKYAVASTVATDTLLQLAEGTLQAPDYAPNADLSKAQQAQAMLEFDTTAKPDKIAVIVSDRETPASAHISQLGLELIPEENA